MNKFFKISILATLLFILFIIGRLYFYHPQKGPALPVSNNEIKSEASTSKVIETVWMDYSNSQLGFSLKFPQNVFATGFCNREQLASPIRILEDDTRGRVYLFQDYYGNNKDGQCVKIIHSVDDIRKQTEETAKENFFPSYNFGWTIIINDIQNDKDLSKYVKENFGSGCAINNETLQENGTKKFSVKGNDFSNPTDDWGKCNVNYAYKILYSPEKYKLMSVLLGQECKFQNSDPTTATPSTYQCYDNEMINSFKFE